MVFEPSVNATQNLLLCLNASSDITYSPIPMKNEITKKLSENNGATVHVTIRLNTVRIMDFFDTKCFSTATPHPTVTIPVNIDNMYKGTSVTSDNHQGLSSPQDKWILFLSGICFVNEITTYCK